MVTVSSHVAENGSTNSSITFFVWRLCAWAGPVFMVGLLISWGAVAGFVPPPPQHLTAQQVAAFFTVHNLNIRLGMVGMLFFAPFYYAWSAVISRIIRRIEGPNGILWQLEFAGGITTSMVTLGCAAMWLGASFRTETRSSEDIQLLFDMGWIIFNMTFMVTVLQMFAFGGALLLDKRPDPLIPKWMGWLSFAAALTFLAVLLMPFFMDGPFAWHGLMTYWVALSAFFTWMGLACYYLFNAINKVENESLI